MREFEAKQWEEEGWKKFLTVFTWCKDEEFVEHDYENNLVELGYFVMEFVKIPSEFAAVIDFYIRNNPLKIKEKLETL